MNHRSRSHLGSGSALPSVFDTMSEPDYEGDHRSEVSADSPCDGMEEEAGGTSTEQAKELQRLCDGDPTFLPEIVPSDASQLANASLGRLPKEVKGSGAEQAKKLQRFCNGDPTFLPEVRPAKRWRAQVLQSAAQRFCNGDPSFLPEVRPTVKRSHAVPADSSME